MAEINHTSGSWDRRVLDDDTLLITDNRGRRVASIDNYGVVGGRGPAAKSERLRNTANGRLIVAALDLLAAAKHALPGCVGESAKLLKNAIAKAEPNQKGVPNG